MPCEPGASDHWFGAGADHLARSAVLPQRDLRHVGLGEIPDAPVAELPALAVKRVQAVQIGQREAIDKILVGAADENLVGLRRAKQKLRDDGVGVASRRTQNDLARRRRQPVSLQIRRGHDVLDDIRRRASPPAA